MRKMTDTEDFEIKCMELIANSGEAKSLYIEAIRLARQGDFKKAKELWDSAGKTYQNAHNVHFDMFQMEVGVESNLQRMFLIHAEDQLSGAETFKLVSEEIIELYRKLYNSSSND